MVNEFLIRPEQGESPTLFADRIGLEYNKSVNAQYKKNYGQFFTPVEIAHLMASLCGSQQTHLRVLDPGCGVGILSCALIEHLVTNSNLQYVELVTYEIDKHLSPYSELTLNYLAKWLDTKGVRLDFQHKNSDFILDQSETLSKGLNLRYFDVIISNPPYFKLQKNDDWINVSKSIIGTQPNIYSIFIGLATKLIAENGEIISITPRSFASGNYFMTFRNLYFTTIQINWIHLFNSRRNIFGRDKVLQETVIMKATKCGIDKNDSVTISSSSGLTDITKPTIKSFRVNELIDLKSEEKILHLPTNEKEAAILELIRNWSNTLEKYDIHISTGPVVSFRAKNWTQSFFEKDMDYLAPLIWLQNVKKMSLEWPLKQIDKEQYIQIQDASLSILLPNKNYIFLRRFSTKDDKSRLIAAPYFSNYVTSDFIGVENKVNYIYRKNGHLARNEIVGLCALLNSVVFDTYFQIFNGNVNVSATELRQMKLPSLEEIKNIGDLIILSNDYSMENVNETINNQYKLKSIAAC